MFGMDIINKVYACVSLGTKLSKALMGFYHENNSEIGFESGLVIEVWDFRVMIRGFQMQLEK